MEKYTVVHASNIHIVMLYERQQYYNVHAASNIEFCTWFTAPMFGVVAQILRMHDVRIKTVSL